MAVLEPAAVLSLPPGSSGDCPLPGMRAEPVPNIDAALTAIPNVTIQQVWEQLLDQHHAYVSYVP
ncbi:hypothetical protein [Nocardia jinanensis]|uniref:Uncharacterized protein n=1 Tax=Nocardia jinanensis TaxID=382504 RepID=A0A917RDN8_9NOCA|nr:hypothetical protein [Nocardia jinanensis]GGL03274.1 hypothetical protein GCM10011588_17460 [Nocardia jinanensis]